MSTIVVKYNGVDITDDVIIADAEFVARTDGSVGDADFTVRDKKTGSYPTGYFKVGGEVTLDVDGVRVWGGYAEVVTYEYPMSVLDTSVPDDVDRFWKIRCVDYNILFQKRVLWNRAAPTKQMRTYTPSDWADSDKGIIIDMVDLYLDLSGDGFDTSGPNAINLDNVEELGQISWRTACSTTWQAASPGMAWGDGMRHIAAWSGGVFYIGPANPSQTHKGPTLYYHDVNSVTGPYQLNDRPASQGGSDGVQELVHTVDAGRLATEGLIWGAGMGSTEMVFSRETAQTQIDNYIRFQWSDFAQSMYKLECIEERVKTYIHGSRQNKRGHKKPRETWRCTIYVPDFMVGMTVDMESYVFGVQDNVPIREMVIKFVNPSAASFQLTLSHALDTAYSTSQWWNPDDDGPDDPKPRNGSGPDWYTETIPFGLGPIITPGPAQPPYDNGLGQEPGPDFILAGKIRTWEDGTTQKQGTIPLLPGTDWTLGAYIQRFAPMAWYDSRCCEWVGVGCWGGSSVTVQYWYAGVLSESETRSLYILGETASYAGVAAGVAIDLVYDTDGFQSAFNAQDNATSSPAGAQNIGSFGGGGVTGTAGQSGYIGTEPTREGSYSGGPSHHHWYCGYWGGYTQIPTMWIPGAGPEGQDQESEGLTWIVLTPQWEAGGTSGKNEEGSYAAENDARYGFNQCDSGAYPDTAYTTGIAAAHGPFEQGQGGSGHYHPPARFDDTFFFTGGTNPYDGSTNPTWPEPTYHQGPSEKDYYTTFPYVPGTVSINMGGIPLQAGNGFWEIDPTTGHIRVHIGGYYSVGKFTVTYMRASADAVSVPDSEDFYEEDGTDPEPGHPADIPGGRVYRPTFKSAYGWKTQYDGYNVPYAATAMYLDRATHGARNLSPADVRTAMNDTTYDWPNLSGLATLIEGTYGETATLVGPVDWDAFRSWINNQRGAIVLGNASALEFWDLDPRSEYTGAPMRGNHALFVNEIRQSDGYIYCYDAAFVRGSKYDITPGFYPPDAVRAYAGSRTGSNSRLYALFTAQTPRI